jgi:hypothetical protein
MKTMPAAGEFCHRLALAKTACPSGFRLSEIRYETVLSSRLLLREPRFTCQACGELDADVRPDWQNVEECA